MSFLNKFKANPKQLVGPNVTEAPVREISLSGTKLSFSCPPQTAKIPPFTGGDDFDVDTAPEVIEGASSKNNASALIYASGWNFHDRAFMGTDYGGLDLDIVLMKNLQSREGANSLFIKSQLEKWVCDTLESVYGKWNKDMLDNSADYAEPVVPENDFWQYPKSSDDLQWTKINNKDWISYEVFQPGCEPDIRYETAITQRHVIRATWSPNAFNGLDFFSSEHNLRVATRACIEAIMSTMTIKLSTEAKRRLEEAESY